MRNDDFSVKINAAESVTGVSSGADFLKIGHQFRKRFRIHDRARKLVRSDLTALLQDVNVLGGELGLRSAGVVLFD